MRAALLLMLVCLCSVGCDPRPPITRTQVGVIAGNLQLREGLSWGDPRDVQPPVEFAGHRWWQVTYAQDRIILVDADSGWARLPMPGYPIRRAATPAVSTSTAPEMVADGSWLLVLEPSLRREPAQEGALEREAARLNALAAQTGLYPLFSVRLDRQGQSALVYGWQGDRGIAQDPRVDAWLKLRTDHKLARWTDLLAGTP